MKKLQVSGGCCGSRPILGAVHLTVPTEIRTEHDLARVVEVGRGDSSFTKTFLALLDERHAVYRGVGTPAVTRMRGELLLALGHRALPSSALPFVLEELESAHDAWLTAVAAHVLRKYPEPSPTFAEPLLAAVFSIRHRDEIVRLPNNGQSRANPGGEPTTAMAEVLQTIAWLGPAGAACAARLEQLRARKPGPATSANLAKAIEAIRSDDPSVVLAKPSGEDSQAVLSTPGSDISDLRLQDHGAIELTFANAFHGRTSIVVFFYTRCDNPTKCPLTMYRLGSLQRSLEQSGLAGSIGLAAITYDPEYDRPERLLQYAESWGAKPSALLRILRTVDDFERVSNYFSLGVNFSASGIVNRHQLEAFVLDKQGRIAHTVKRRRWDEAELTRLAAQTDGL